MFRLVVKIISALLLLFYQAGVISATEPSKTNIQIANNILLSFSVEDFVKSGNKMTDCGGGYICLVNDKPFWGSGGGVPTKILSKLELDLKGKKIHLDTSGMYNPMVLKNDKNRYQVLNHYDDVWKVRGRFSDGEVTYYAEWLVANGHAMRVVIGGSELLYDAFDHIFKKK